MRKLIIILMATGVFFLGGGLEEAYATGVQGGLIVHLGCTDGKKTAELCVSDQHIVQGLSTDKASVRKAREYIHSKGLGGRGLSQRF